MKLNLLSIVALSAFSISMPSFAADPVTIKGGKINFTGDLVNAACAVSTKSADQTVNLGQYRTTLLAKAGDKTTAMPFQIELVGCDPVVQATAAVAFQGSLAEGGTNLLAVSSTNGNGLVAKNVGIQITDSSSKIMGLAGAAYSTPATLLAGDNTLQFNAYCVATGVASPGQANASATFTVKYE